MNRINWLGVIVATIVAFFIGVLWYGLLFEAQWLALTGTAKPEEMSMLPMVWGLAQTFVTMAGLGWFIGGGGLMDGVKTGLIAAVCFALMTSAYNFIYETANPGLLPIDWSHLLVIYAVGGAIIGAVRMKPKAA